MKKLTALLLALCLCACTALSETAVLDHSSPYGGELTNPNVPTATPSGNHASARKATPTPDPTVIPTIEPTIEPTPDPTVTPTPVSMESREAAAVYIGGELQEPATMTDLADPTPTPSPTPEPTEQIDDAWCVGRWVLNRVTATGDRLIKQEKLVARGIDVSLELFSDYTYTASFLLPGQEAPQIAQGTWERFQKFVYLDENSNALQIDTDKTPHAIRTSKGNVMIWFIKDVE